MSDMRAILAKLADGNTLTAQESEAAFNIIMSGAADLAQMAAFIMALRLRGETVDEIFGGARVLRAKADKLNAPDDSVDIVGTGGDGIGTYNISTASSFVAAAAGASVAKHGNRAVSSKSGASDVLTALGGSLEIGHSDNENCLREVGFAFMFAPSHHKAMRHVGPARASLQLRTIFNLLGPLANPAQTKRQVLGVFDRQWLRPMAEVLKQLGSEHVWVVHGSDGLDEITNTGPTYVAELKDGEITEFEISPGAVGLATAKLDDLKGGDATVNAAAMRAIFSGEQNAYRDIVLMNTAAALVVTGVAEDYATGVKKAAKAIDSGAVTKTLNAWVDYTQKHTPEPSDA